MLDLSSDLFGIIYQYLSPEDILCLRLCCKTIASKNPKGFKRLIYTSCPHPYFHISKWNFHRDSLLLDYQGKILSRCDYIEFEPSNGKIRAIDSKCEVTLYIENFMVTEFLLCIDKRRLIRSIYTYNKTPRILGLRSEVNINYEEEGQEGKVKTRYVKQYYPNNTKLRYKGTYINGKKVKWEHFYLNQQVKTCGEKMDGLWKVKHWSKDGIEK